MVPLLLSILAGCTGAGALPGSPDASGSTTAHVTTEIDHSPVASPTSSGANGDSDQAKAESDAGADLFLVDPETGHTQPILSAKVELHEPEHSPVDARIVYQGTSPTGTPQIFVLDRGRRRQLTHFPGGAVEPTWSPDGSRIAFAARSRGDTDIFVMDADGGHVRRLGDTGRDDRRPDWSPDGSRLVFDSWSTIWVIAIQDGAPTRLTGFDITHRHGPPADATWSPDGRWIAFTRFDPGSINSVIPSARLYVMRSDGTRERRLVPWRKPHGVYELDPSWSPDGRSIAFAALEGVGVSAPSLSSSRIGIVDVQTRRVDYLPTSRAAGLDWGTTGIVASVGSDIAFDPSVWPGRDPWFPEEPW